MDIGYPRQARCIHGFVPGHRPGTFSRRFFWSTTLRIISRRIRNRHASNLARLTRMEPENAVVVGFNLIDQDIRFPSDRLPIRKSEERSFWSSRVRMRRSAFPKRHSIWRTGRGWRCRRSAEKDGGDL